MVKKVAIIVERADVALGGAERSMFEVARALSALDLQVELLAAKGEAGTRDIRVLCANVPGQRVSLPLFGEALKRHFAQADYDIIHSILPFDFADLYQPRGGTYAESMLRNAASYPCPSVRLYKRMTAFANRRRAALLQAERRLCRGSDGPVIAALSQYVVNQLREHYATDPGRIVLTLNGVKTDRRIDANAAEKLRAQTFAELGVTAGDSPVLFLFVAHNFRLKGLHRLIEAMRLVGDVPMGRPACLLVAGAGKSAEYRRLAARLGVKEHIVFLGPISRIQDALAIVDVGILPTFYDPSSRFILEALAAGRPVITTRFNGAADHFTDGRHGKVIDSPDNLAALAEAIRHFSIPARIREASQAIRDDGLAAGISIDRVAKDLLGVYESIQEKGRASKSDVSDLGLGPHRETSR